MLCLQVGTYLFYKAVVISFISVDSNVFILKSVSRSYVGATVVCQDVESDLRACHFSKVLVIRRSCLSKIMLIQSPGRLWSRLLYKQFGCNSTVYVLLDHATRQLYTMHLFENIQMHEYIHTYLYYTLLNLFHLLQHIFKNLQLQSITIGDLTI